MNRKTQLRRLFLLPIIVVGSLLWASCSNRPSYVIAKAESLALTNPYKAVSLLKQVNIASLDEDIHARLALAQALIHDEKRLRQFCDTTVCLQVTDKSWEFHRITKNMINYHRGSISIRKLRLNDSTLLHAYHYYDRKSLGGTSDNREAVRLFGRICYALSYYYDDTDLQPQFDQLIHLAIHSAEVAEDWGIAYRAYHRWAKHIVGFSNHGNSKYGEAYWAICQAMQCYNKSRDFPQHLLTLFNDYGYYYLRIGQFMCLDPQCFGRIQHATSLLHTQQTSPPYDTLFQLIDSVQKAPTLDFFLRSNPSSALISKGETGCITYFEDFQQKRATAKAKKSTINLTNLTTLYSKYMTEAARTFEIESRNYLAPGYVRKASMLQSRLLMTIIALLSLCVAMVLLLFWNWRMKVRQRQEAERKAHQREAEQLAERLQKKDTMITLLREHIMDKSEIMEMLRQNRGNNRRIIIDTHNWREIEATLDSVDNGFVSRLRHDYPKFSEEDIRLCMLTRLKLSNNALANIYSLTVSAVQHRKQKLKKEGFGITDPTVSLEHIVMAL